MKLLGCIVPIDVEPPKSRSGDDAAILGIDHHGCGSQPGGDVLELITNRFVWYHVLKERESMRYRWLQSSLMPTMISVCLDNRFPCSPCMPGGRFRSLEKSTQGGPDVISIIRSSVPWAACRMSSLSWGLVRRETSPCCIDWKWWCKSAWHCGFVSQLRVKRMLAPKYCRAKDAAPMPSKKLR